MSLKGKEALHMYQIGIDIGGTNVKIGLLDEALELTAETSVPFPHTTAADLAKKIRAAVLALLEEKNAALCDVGSLGAVVPGSIDASGETVLDAHNLDFHNVPLRKLLQEQFPGIPVYIANDANGAALAELYKGAFTGCKTGVLLTLGTGLGGGIILNGKMFNGGMNHGVELGHAYLVDGGEPCTCGNYGCVERYCSATAIIRMARELCAVHPESEIVKVCEGDLNRVNAKVVFDAAKNGDEIALKVFHRYVKYLGQLVASLVNCIDPEVIVLGGGVSKAGDFLLDAVRAEARRYVLYKTLPSARIELAKLGPDAGIIGAAMLGK